MKKLSTDKRESNGAMAAKNMSDEQRQKLAEVLDTQLEEELQKLENSGSKYMDGWTEENWEHEMQQHPFFANRDYLDGSKELSPLMKGLQDLKYSPDENTPAELAANYKEDGNFNFKCKKYRMAVISYTEGLRNSTVAMSNMKEMDDESTAITWRSIICHFSRNGHNSLKNCQNQVWRDSERVPFFHLLGLELCCP